ncbi:hypothetical protein HN51_001665, partial [Arachis hypogaea]
LIIFFNFTFDALYTVYLDRSTATSDVVSRMILLLALRFTQFVASTRTRSGVHSKNFVEHLDCEINYNFSSDSARRD